MTEIDKTNETDSIWVKSYKFPDKESAIQAGKHIFNLFLVEKKGTGCLPFFVGIDSEDYILLVGEKTISDTLIQEAENILKEHKATTSALPPLFNILLPYEYQQYQQTGDISRLSFTYDS